LPSCPPGARRPRTCRTMLASPGGRPRSSSPEQARDGPRGPNPKEVLLERLAGSAPAGLPGLAERLIEGHLATRPGPPAWSRSTLPTTTTGRDADELPGQRRRRSGRVLAARSAVAGQHQLHARQQLDSLRRTLTVLTEILARHGHGPGTVAAEAVVSAATAPGAGEAALQAGRAAALGWPSATRVGGPGSSASSAPRPVCCARSCVTWPATRAANGSPHRGRARRAVGVPGPALASRPVPGLRVRRPDEQARHWRDAVLGALARRGTAGGAGPAAAGRFPPGHPHAGQPGPGGRGTAPRPGLVARPSRRPDCAPRGQRDPAWSAAASIWPAWSTGPSWKRPALWSGPASCCGTSTARTTRRYGGRRARSRSAPGSRAAAHVSRAQRGRHQPRGAVRETTTQHGMAVDIQADAPATGASRTSRPAAGSSSRETGTRPD